MGLARSSAAHIFGHVSVYSPCMSQEQIVVHVQIHVKPDGIDAFRRATLTNAAKTRKEAGVLRFDLTQDLEDPTRFALVEVYRDAAAVAAHRETAHYATWRDAVAPLMAEPRVIRRMSNIEPDPT
jgi:quinol monooxygenase YgiN